MFPALMKQICLLNVYLREFCNLTGGMRIEIELVVGNLYGVLLNDSSGVFMFFARLYLSLGIKTGVATVDYLLN